MEAIPATQLYLSEYDPYDANFTSKDAQRWRQEWTRHCLEKGNGQEADELGQFAGRHHLNRGLLLQHVTST
jgi:hypothetical protein